MLQMVIGMEEPLSPHWKPASPTRVLSSFLRAAASILPTEAVWGPSFLRSCCGQGRAGCLSWFGTCFVFNTALALSEQGMLLSRWVERWGAKELLWCCISLMVKRVRVAAAESMPLLLECARVRGPEYLTQMWHFMCDALIKAIGTEPDSDVLSEIMHSFAKVNVFSEYFPPAS